MGRNAGGLQDTQWTPLYMHSLPGVHSATPVGL
jgi:hypothetical protein